MRHLTHHVHLTIHHSLILPSGYPPSSPTSHTPDSPRLGTKVEKSPDFSHEFETDFALDDGDTETEKGKVQELD